jgi:hypothetical protein
MKLIQKSTIFVATILLMVACSGSDRGGNRKMENDKELAKKERLADPTPVEISIEQLVGTWKYAEVRVLPFEKGIPPMGELLLGITSDFTLSHATEGKEELKNNLINVPSPFEIKDNQLCATDKLAEFEFKMSFGNTKVNCYLLNKTEMILGKDGPDGSTVLYKYFSRVE